MAMETISRLLKIAAGSIDSVGTYWADRINNEYGIKVIHYGSDKPADPVIVRQIYYILTRIPVKVIKACKVYTLYIRDDLGPSHRFSPNHGYYRGSEIALNSDIFYHPDLPDDFMDYRGYFVDRPTQTLVHEIGHAFDQNLGDLSLQESWLKLSGWSETPKSGLKKLFVQEEGAPDLVGEWFYDPEAEFTRFYARRNPWDDFADSFSMRFCLPDKLPRVKKEYFDALLKDIIKTS